MKLKSQHLMIAVFLVFIFAMAATVFIPNITAAATAQQQTDGLSVILIWALPILAIIAVVAYCSHKAVCAGKTVE